MTYAGNQCDRDVFAFGAEHAGKPVCTVHLVGLAGHNTKWLTNRTNIGAVVAFGPEVLRQGERVLRGKESLGPLVQGELHDRKVVECSYAGSVEQAECNDTWNPYTDPASGVPAIRRCVLADEG